MCAAGALDPHRLFKALVAHGLGQGVLAFEIGRIAGTQVVVGEKPIQVQLIAHHTIHHADVVGDVCMAQSGNLGTKLALRHKWFVAGAKGCPGVVSFGMHEFLEFSPDLVIGIHSQCLGTTVQVGSTEQCFSGLHSGAFTQDLGQVLGRLPGLTVGLLYQLPGIGSGDVQYFHVNIYQDLVAFF